MGLREQIKKAGSEAEINELISKSKTFEFASDRTKSAWKSTAKNRIVELSNTVSESSAPDSNTKKNNPKKSKSKSK